MTTDKLYKAFPITSVCREDIIAAGISEKEVNKLDNDDMTEIASKMADAYTNKVFWIDAEIITNYVLSEK